MLPGHLFPANKHAFKGLACIRKDLPVHSGPFRIISPPPPPHRPDALQHVTSGFHRPSERRCMLLGLQVSKLPCIFVCDVGCSLAGRSARMRISQKVFRSEGDLLRHPEETRHIENGWAAVCFRQGGVKSTAYVRDDFPLNYCSSFLPIYLLEL